MDIAERHHDKPFFFYLGRHVGLPVCLEGALKLKEIGYIPTEAYAAGEMKHGPIALLDDETPVVCVATARTSPTSWRRTCEEVRARGAQVIAIATRRRRRHRRRRRGPLGAAAPIRCCSRCWRRPAPAARLPRRARSRPRRRPAAQPRQDGDGRMTVGTAIQAAEAGRPGAARAGTVSIPVTIAFVLSATGSSDVLVVGGDARKHSRLRRRPWPACAAWPRAATTP